MSGFFKKKGLTLIEVLFAAAIMAFCLSGLLLTYINLFVLTDLARDFTTVTNALQAKMEEIKNVAFANLAALNNTTFNVTAANSTDVIGKGVIQVSDIGDPFTNTTYTDLKKVRTVISFKSRSRVIGEDKNLNGILDPGEDDAVYGANGTSRMDSPVEAITIIKSFTNSTS
jgi:prepilin-type N-terminal cleavage/methylation domain-containing protein